VGVFDHENNHLRSAALGLNGRQTKEDDTDEKKRGNGGFRSDAPIFVRTIFVRTFFVRMIFVRTVFVRTIFVQTFLLERFLFE
jgi:hypothetical protein